MFSYVKMGITTSLLEVMTIYNEILRLEEEI